MDDNKLEYIIDLADARTKEDLHEAIRSTLPVPEYYGNNLDALFDVLASFPEPCTILFVNVTDASQAMPEYMAQLKEMCRDVQWENRALQIMFSLR